MQLLIWGLVYLFLVAFRLYLRYRKLLNSINHHPGFRLALSPSSLLGNVLPRIPYIALGLHWPMAEKHQIFAKAGWDVLSAASFIQGFRVDYLIADPTAIKDITLYRTRFPKPVEDYVVLSYFGQNILITDDDEWKKHRKICGPSFSERHFNFVCDETVRIMLEMFESWGSEKEIDQDHCELTALKITLLVISAAAFGQQIPWSGDSHIPPGHELSFKEALHTISTRVQQKVITPNWLYKFSKSLRYLLLAEKELQMYMEEMIADRRASEKTLERSDLFNALLDANERDTEDKLSDQEVIGNIFIFLIAGHETTGHTLAFALGLLAIEQAEQEKLYRHILSVIPEGEIPTYDNINSLTYSMAVIQETLRFFPPVTGIPKFSMEDTTLPLVRPDGSTGTFLVPKGAKLTIDTVGLHYNPRYWTDPHTFNPSRFFGDWPRFAFIPFSAGARACIGRRFAEIETVVVITMLISRYKIELKNPELYEGLSSLEKREKLLASRPGLTTTPLHVPLVFKRR